MKRILIIRPSAIGDIVMAAPLIGSLRQAFPDAHIAWLADPAARELLEDHPALDEVILWSKARWRHLATSGRLPALFGEIRRFRKSLRSKRFDTAIDAQGLLRSRLLAWLTAAEQRIGFDSSEPGKRLMTRIVAKGPDTWKMGKEYVFLLKQLGIAPCRHQPSIVLSARIRAQAARALKNIGLEAPYAAFCPFTTRPQKHWLDERWGQLADLVRQRHGLPAVLLGGPADVAHSRYLQSQSAARIYSLTGMTRLGESAAVIQNAALIIGVDTGLTHLGSAFQRPTIGLFGATCPYRRTDNPDTRIIYHPMACSPCKRKPVCEGRYDCMKAITVAAVGETVGDLLKQPVCQTHADSSY